MALLAGVDGGSTKTAAVLITDEGSILARARGPGSAIVGRPDPKASSVLASAMKTLCSEADVSQEHIQLCCVGLCGVDFEDELPVQVEGVAAALALPKERVVLVNDGIIALWGATPKPAATILQHGSGFTGAYRAKHGDEVLFDHLSIADTFDMRRGLISVVARMINGMVQPTPLKDRALAHFGIVDEQQYCEAVYRHFIPSDRRVSTPPLIFSAWLEGDPAAGQLVERAIRDYGLAAKAMIAATGSTNPDVRFGGGVLRQAPEEFWQSLGDAIQQTHPLVTVKPPDLAPELGGAVMAGYHTGLDPVQLFQQLRGNV